MAEDLKNMCQSCGKEEATHTAHFSDREILLGEECTEVLLEQVFKNTPSTDAFERVLTAKMIS